MCQPVLGMVRIVGVTWEIREGDVLDRIREIPDESVHCVITSPPYWGLRDYGFAGQIGLEATPEAYVARMVEIFREVRRVLRSDGTCWLNIGDSYTSGGRATRAPDRKYLGPRESEVRAATPHGLKPKELVGIPWRIAFALQSEGWWLRSDIIWAKPNAMPESVADRPTLAHEYLFLLTKAGRYYYDADAIRERGVDLARQRRDRIGGANGHKVRHSPGSMIGASTTRNARSVWSITTEPYTEAHFATFPPELPRRCIAAGCPPGGVVLDPFAGVGTTVMVALRLGRSAIGIELNPEYAAMARRRIVADHGVPQLQAVELAVPAQIQLGL